jgi:hypothetical protein
LCRLSPEGTSIVVGMIFSENRLPLFPNMR